MHFLALAADYDGTIAHDSVVDDATVAALQRIKETGRRLVLVTGRELPDLKRVFPAIHMFDRVVAENGALIYEERALVPPPSAAFLEALRQRGVAPLSVGRAIVATWEPHEATVLEVIRELGLELQITFNKGAVMVLPAGMNKAAGLSMALKELQLSPHNVVAVGDAENDHAFLRCCSCAAAVGNALPMLKQAADIRLGGARGAGVAELVEMICRDDARIIPPERHGLALGTFHDGSVAFIEPHRGSVLIARRSGIGKSTLAIALTERMVEKEHEFCIFDPEGDYDGLENAIAIGDGKVPPRAGEALQLLRKADTNVVVNTQALDVAERPQFFAQLLPQIGSMRARTGRPHWLVIDEAHHLLPHARGNLPQVLPGELPAAIFITVHPEAVSAHLLRTVQLVVGLGEDAREVLAAFGKAAGVEVPPDPPRPAATEVLVWYRYLEAMPQPVQPTQPNQVHRRHTQKYAEGDVGDDLSFYFRGPEKALNLRAQNLLFQQIADGVDDRTWEHHLRAGDYSRWFRDVIKNCELAQATQKIEEDRSLDAKESRERIRESVRRLYTAPARGDDS